MIAFSHFESSVLIKAVREGMAGVANIITYEQTQSIRACNFRFFDVVLASKGSNFSKLITHRRRKRGGGGGAGPPPII